MVHQEEQTAIVPNVEVEFMLVFIHVTQCLGDEEWGGTSHLFEADADGLWATGKVAAPKIDQL